MNSSQILARYAPPLFDSNDAMLPSAEEAETRPPGVKRHPRRERTGGQNHHPSTMMRVVKRLARLCKTGGYRSTHVGRPRRSKFGLSPQYLFRQKSLRPFRHLGKGAKDLAVEGHERKTFADGKLDEQGVIHGHA